MRRCAPCRSRARRPFGSSARPAGARRGFTLLEMCVVLLIMGILLGVSMPAMRSAFTEQGMRDDSRQLALMVRTAMLQSDEQRRPYAIDLTGTKATLHALKPISDANDSTTDTSDETPVSGSDVSFNFDSSNKLLVADPDKAGAWIPVPSTSWVFQPGDLCHVPRVRLLRGKAWMEISFNALTGNVEDETTYFP